MSSGACASLSVYFLLFLPFTLDFVLSFRVCY